MQKYKLVIGTELPGCFGKKGVDKPRLFNTLEDLKKYYQKRKKEIEKDNWKIWFVKVWEFGKEDYIDMDIDLE